MHCPLGDVAEILNVLKAEILNVLIDEHGLIIDTSCITSEIDVMWIAQDPIADKSTLVQVMACYQMASRHHLNQC